MTSQFYERHPKSVSQNVIPPKGLEHFSFGHQNAFADSLWLRAIQDFDYCEEKLSEHVCKGKSWLFQTLDVAADLSPHFLQIYRIGAIALSVIISDVPGASVLFDRGVKEFPHDWILLYKAAYHALFEEKDKAKAAHLMEEAAKNGAPSWVFVTATKLYTEAGAEVLAEHLMNDLEKSDLDPHLLESIRNHLRSQTRSISSDKK